MTALFRKCQRQQVGAKRQFIASTDLPINVVMGRAPDRHGLDQKIATGIGQTQAPISLVPRILRNVEKSTPFKRFEISGKRCPVHGQKAGDIPDTRRRGPVERDQQGILTIGEIEWPERLIETPANRPRRTLQLQTKTTVSYFVSDRKRKIFVHSETIG